MSETGGGSSRHDGGTPTQPSSSHAGGFPGLGTSLPLAPTPTMTTTPAVATRRGKRPSEAPTHSKSRSSVNTSSAPPFITTSYVLTPLHPLPPPMAMSANTTTSWSPHPRTVGKSSKSKKPSHPKHQGKKMKGKRGRGRPSPATSSRKAATVVRHNTNDESYNPRDSASAPTRGGGAAGPLVHITSDECPDRIVNPLLGFPTDEPVHGSELWAWTDVVFALPDTYPLSYLGRLLGLEIPPSEGQVFPTEMKVQELSFLDPRRDAFFHVPPLGPSLPATTTTRGQPRLCGGGGDGDDRRTLDYVDPVYDHFVKRGFDRSLCRPGSASLLSRLATSTITPETRASIVDAAKEWLDSESWSFDEWKATTTTTTTTRDAQWTLEEDGKSKVYVSPPPHSFGIIATFWGQPMYLLHYKFMWYPIQETKESELVLILVGIVPRSGTVIHMGRDHTSSEELAATAAELNPTEVLPPTAATLAVPPPPQPQPLVEEGALSSVRAAEGITLPGMTVPRVELPESIRWMMLTLVLEHARAADIWYGLWNVPPDMVAMNERCFRMTRLPLPPQPPTASSSSKEGLIPMVCDMKKGSWNYAILAYTMPTKEGGGEGGPDPSDVVVTRDCDDSAIDIGSTVQQRVLIKLPLAEEAKAMFEPAFVETQRKKRTSTSNADSNQFTSANEAARAMVVGVRAELSGTSDVRLHSLTADGEESELVLNEVVQGQRVPELEILRRFPLAVQESMRDDHHDHDDEILKELLLKQDVLLKSERALQPRIRSLMQCVIDERIAYESPEARAKRAEDLRILNEHDEYITRRKELDQAEQEQRELDMNAVCSICNDGEVTPENQILFCEACDVPVHQFCYGIEKIPEGDYYCIPCRHFGRDKMSREQDRTSSTGAHIALPPLPFNCELCPVKKGAYVRSDTSKSAPNSEVSKWVHMACAKWQGLHFIVPDIPDLVEDVTELKRYFRRKDMQCDICQGKRGAYHQCRHPGCEKFFHLSCARAIGVCEVIHGENVEGQVENNPWTLMCAEHSTIDEDDVPKERIPVERLIQMAIELGNDPMPDPLPAARKPFNKLNGTERTLALRDPVYETQFIEEILKKRFAGNRCEVCWTMEDDGKNLARCGDCQSVICFACRLSDKGEVNPDQKNFKCFSCRFVREKTKAGEEFDPPQCIMCNQKSGLMLKSFAKPTKMTPWKNNPEEFEKTLYAMELWTHYTCAYWLTQAGLVVDGDACTVNISNVVMANGRGLVKAKQICHLCGLPNGLKAQCSDSNCRANGEKRHPYRFHVTCAREAGYEVDEEPASFFVKCYFHGACEYNLRARLEDFMEVEKRRTGNNFSKSDAPMTFSDGSRILNQAIAVMRMLGWAWRWAEHWVEWGSNWEPLLEQGQKEEKMTKTELKIIDSTAESRAEDARRCRLSAFGAALRNRSYDTENGFDNDSLCRALTAVLNTQSLVGPLTQPEISLAVDWLSRAYRSKSKFLGFGEDKITVATDGFCIHRVDKSPKYQLGDRPLPGKALLEPDQIFENKVEEPDDFLLPELSTDGTTCTLPPNCIREVKRKVIKFRKPKYDDDDQANNDDNKQGTSLQPKSEKQTTKKLAIVLDSPRNKLGRRSKGEPEKVYTQSDVVAAMVPSAVRKRVTVRPVETPGKGKNHSVVVRSPPAPPMVKQLFSTKKIIGAPSVIAQVMYQDILDADNDDSVLRKVGRRGRPPKFIEFLVFVKVDGQDFFPESDPNSGGVQEHEQEDVQEPEQNGVQVTEPADVPIMAQEGIQEVEKEVAHAILQHGLKETEQNAAQETEKAAVRGIAQEGVQETEHEGTQETEQGAAQETERAAAQETEKAAAQESEKAAVPGITRQVAEETEQTFFSETDQQVIQEASRGPSQEIVVEGAQSTCRQDVSEEAIQESPATLAIKTPRKADTSDAVDSINNDVFKIPQASISESAAMESDSHEQATPMLNSDEVTETIAYGRFPARARRSTEHFNPSSFKKESKNVDGSPPRKRRRTVDVQTSQTPLKSRTSPRVQSFRASRERSVEAQPESQKPSRLSSSRRKERENESSHKSAKKRGRQAKQKAEDEVVQEILVSSDEEVYVMRGKNRDSTRSPGTPSPSKQRLRRSARSPGRPLLDEDDN